MIRPLAPLAILAIWLLALAACSGDGDAGLTAAFDAEFHTRPDGYKGLCAHYGFTFPREPRQMDPGLMYRAVADGQVDVIDGFATDGRIALYDLLVLEDDQHFFPPYHAAPVIRREILERHPRIREVLAPLADAIDDATMRGLNLAVDEEGRAAGEVARAFLVDHDLLAADATPGPGTAGTIRVGGKQFTEQEILGELIAILIECGTDCAVDRKLNLGGTMICFNALRYGDLDCYAEYTGTGLVTILEQPASTDADATWQQVADGFAERYDLVVLPPFGFNNTYTLTMRRQRAEELGIATISDLGRYLGGSTQEAVQP